MLERFTRRDRRRDGMRPASSLIATILVALCVLAVAPWMSRPAQAAGAAYAVDTSEVSAPGSCKVESWLSWASNHDFTGVGNPACVVGLGDRTELSAQISRSRADEEWTTAIAPKAKTRLMPSAIGSFGLAVSATATYDLITRENTQVFVNAPATLRLSEVVRINVNAGWQWDRIIDRHYLFYGLGVDWRTPDNVYTLTAEIFGLAGPAQEEVSTITRPRFQTGLRWRPIDRFSIDFIYGRNIYGENANWFTVATTIRFPPPGGKVGSE
jgi:hypothetical protein